MNNQEEGPAKFSLQLPPTVNLDGAKVRKIREAKGLTQLYVASSVGVTTDTISRWENKRYPTVKRENVLKLAEALEVDLCDLLEKREIDRLKGQQSKDDEPESESCKNRAEIPSDEMAQPHDQARSPGPDPHRTKQLLAGILVLLLAGVATGLYIFYKPRGEFLEITATRFLPDHSAPGQLFPVIIDIYVRPEKQRTLLLKDGAGPGIEFLKGIPPFTSHTGNSIKWIYTGKLGYSKFIYLARINSQFPQGETVRFKGEVTIKNLKKKSFPLKGNGLITAIPFSWADLNKDHIIDDEEILEAYDLLSDVKAAGNILKEVEGLWSAGGYMWDINEKRFLPVSRKTEEDKGH